MAALKYFFIFGVHLFYYHVPRYGLLCTYTVLGLLNFSDLCIDIFHQIGAISIIIFFKYFYAQSLSLLYSNYMAIKHLSTDAEH